MAILPRCLTLVMCDRVGRKAGSGKASPVGVFHSFNLPRLPGSTQPFSVWVEATNAVGWLRMDLVFERALPDRPEFEELLVVPFTMSFANSMAIVEHVAVIEDGIDLPGEGSYRLSLECAGTSILSRAFVVRRVS